MKRRVLMQVGVVVVMLAVALGVGPQGTPTALAQKTMTLKMQATWPSGLTLYDNFVMFADKVNKMTAGKVKIETLPAGAVVGAFEVLDAVARGVIDGGHAWAGYWVGKDRAAILFTGGPGGPFGMDYIDFLGWIYEGGGFELYQELYQKVLRLDVVAIPILPSGPQALGWFNKQINSWEDFKGLKYRIPGMGAEIFKEAGMSVVTLPGAEILPAAERGVIDAAEWVGGIEDLKLGFHNVWKLHYTPGMHEPVTVGELIINKDVWDKLSPDIQEIFKTAAQATFMRWWVGWQRQNALAYKEMIEKHGVEVHRTPDDILLKFLETWDQLAAKEAAANPFFKKVLESQKQYASLVVPYRRSTWPPYEFASDYYWKEAIFLK